MGAIIDFFTEAPKWLVAHGVPLWAVFILLTMGSAAKIFGAIYNESIVALVTRLPGGRNKNIAAFLQKIVLWLGGKNGKRAVRAYVVAESIGWLIACGFVVALWFGLHYG